MSWHLPASGPLPTSQGWGVGVPGSRPPPAPRRPGGWAGRRLRGAAAAGAVRGWGRGSQDGTGGRCCAGCALAPSGEAAEGGTGGIRSPHGNSCTDSGGWAGARGGGRRKGAARGGEGRGDGARTRARALSRTPSTLLGCPPLPFPGFLPHAGPEPRSRPPGAC